MVLVFIILGMVILTLLIFIVFLFSTIKIEIKNLRVGNGYDSLFQNKNNLNINTDAFKIRDMNKSNTQYSKIKGKYEIKISLKLLEKIPIFWIKLDNKKISQMRSSKRFQNIDLKKIKNKFKEKQPSKKQILQEIRKIKIKLEYLNLIVYIGTENSVITSYVTAFIASIIGLVLPHLAGKNINNCRYEITPIYQNKNEYYISLDGILCIKVVHIINSMCNLIKKGRDKKYERTSNRRSYAYRYE